MSDTQGSSLVARIFERVLPKSPDFFGMLARQSAAAEHTVELLVEFMETGDVDFSEQIYADEHAADDVKVSNIHVLNEAFSTPIDREDIYRAIVNLDDIVNYCKSTVNEMDALGVKPDRHMFEMAQMLLSGTTALRNGFGKLGNNTTMADQDAEGARKAEHRVERIYRLALADLFQGEDYIQMFKKREIYRHLSNAADRMSHCASTLHDIVVKMV